MIYFYISLLTYIFYTGIKYKESLYLLSKKKYNNKEYFYEVKKTKYFFTEELLIIPLIIIALNLDLKTIEISTLTVYTFLSLKNIKKIKTKIQKKTITRIIILIIIQILLNIWFIKDYNSYHNPKGLIFDNTSLYYIILYLFTYFSNYVTLIINTVSNQIDRLLK